MAALCSETNTDVQSPWQLVYGVGFSGNSDSSAENSQNNSPKRTDAGKIGNGELSPGVFRDSVVATPSSLLNEADISKAMRGKSHGTAAPIERNSIGSNRGLERPSGRTHRAKSVQISSSGVLSNREVVSPNCSVSLIYYRTPLF